MRVLITGATSGIGLELARIYAEAGHTVAICGRKIMKVPESLAHNKAVHLYSCDVNNAEEMEKVVREFGGEGLDLIIACAGRSVGKKTKLPDFNTARDVISTNVLGVINTVAPAFEIMQKQGRGHIVAVASVAGFVGLPGASSYSASKAAVIKLCESWELDSKNWGIDITCICPGFIDTPLTRQNNHSMPFLMSVEKGAQKIYCAIQKKKRRYIFPWQMRIAIGFLDKVPRVMYRWIMKMPFFNYSSKDS